MNHARKKTFLRSDPADWEVCQRLSDSVQPQYSLHAGRACQAQFGESRFGIGIRSSGLIDPLGDPAIMPDRSRINGPDGA